jgi:hypothetical protein
MSKVQEVIEVTERLDALLKDIEQDDIRPIFDAILSSGKVKTVHWRQYAPSFNDGEPCYFSVHEPEFYMGEDWEDADTKYLEEHREAGTEGDFWQEVCDRADYGAEPEGMKAEIEKLDKLFSAESVMEAVFGDGSQIVAWWNAKEGRTEFEVSEYYDC